MPAVDKKLRNKIQQKINQKQRTADNINQFQPFTGNLKIEDLPPNIYYPDPLQLLNPNPSNTNQRAPRLLFEVDWLKYAGPVRHQRLCGACFAFATVNNVEALYAKHVFGGYFFEFSVQQIIDCAMLSYDGCNGGLLQWSMAFMKYNGITSGFEYPYTSGQTGSYSG